MTTRKTSRQDHTPATLSEADGVRYLHLDSIWVQGAMRIRKPLHLELEYIQRMMAWMLWRPSAELCRGRAVQLGLGAGALTRFAHSRLRMHTTAVEFNPSVISACRTWFHLPQDTARLAVVQADAAHWVADAQHWDQVQVLNVDLYDHDAAGPVLDSEEFYSLCRKTLVPGGLMTVNLFGRHASFALSARRIAKAFGSDQVWQLAPTREGNTVVVAANGVTVPDREELLRRAAHIEARFDLPATKWLRLVRPLPLSILQTPEGEGDD
ncbi:spermidine synthase [Roseateles sp. BYS180W]|uniref:Spermidine synthase n=1 Tax=Roseateles rivi TaxID=3299028 RepID=A0ABW7FXN8_9BURK